MAFSVIEPQRQEAVIRVMGVGGCGGNAVNHMIKRGVKGVEFISANTDAQALKQSMATQQIQLGMNLTRGLGAGAKPEIGRDAAKEDHDRIAELIDGSDMLFITAGMGGGTGTGAAPVIAQVARQLGILTVAVVTRPFAFEGKREVIAQSGIEELAKHVDSLIVVPNAKLMEVLGRQTKLLDAYAASNDVLHGAVAGIAEVINKNGMVNVDFADVRTIMQEPGSAMMGTASASGVDRAIKAAEAAVRSPLLEDVDLTGARGVLVNITSDMNFDLGELDDVMQTIRSFTAPDATVIYGQAFDDSLEDELRVTVIATGLNSQHARRTTQPFLKPVDLQALRTGTDNMPVMSGGGLNANAGIPTLESAVGGGSYNAVSRPDYNEFDSATVLRNPRRGQADSFDIPTFLRKQAD
jgi:cell division protein FtsZ